MSDYVDYNDLGSKTLSASGGSASYGRVPVNDKERLVLWVEGDSNTTDLDLQIDSAEQAGATVGDWQEVTAIDVTTHPNNKKQVVELDVRGIAEVEIEAINNAGSSTTPQILANTHDSV